MTGNDSSSMLKQTMPGAKLTSLKITPEDMLDVSSELKAELGFSADGLTGCRKWNRRREFALDRQYSGRG